jgi:hypothetical protein
VDAASVTQLVNALLDLDHDDEMSAMRGLGVRCLTDPMLPPGLSLTLNLSQKVDTVVRIAKEVLTHEAMKDPAVIAELKLAGYYVVDSGRKVTIATHHSCICFKHKSN